MIVTANQTPFFQLCFRRRTGEWELKIAFKRCFHHFSRGIPGTNFNIVPCLELDIPRGFIPMYTYYITKKVYAKRINCFLLGGFENLRNTIYQGVSYR